MQRNASQKKNFTIGGADAFPDFLGAKHGRTPDEQGLVYTEELEHSPPTVHF